MGVPMNKLENLSFNSQRRIGVELEVNAFDGRNRPETGKRPAGIEHVCRVVQENTEEGAMLKEWEHTQENEQWVCKPDSSCGIEVCTPPLKGWRGIRKVVQVVDAFAKDPKIKVDKRCSVHVHVEVADLSETQIGSVITHWVKCEPIFMDLVPPERKKNRYCQFVGMTTLFDTDVILTPGDIIKRVGDVKYYTLNTNQYRRSNGTRKTLEFRIIEGAGCKDPYLVKNWIRLLLHFVERTSKMPMPGPYKKDDPWSSYCWLDTKDVMRLLGFHNDPHQYELSKGLTQTRNWMLARLMKYMMPDTEKGPRWKAFAELQEILAKFKEEGTVIDPQEHLSPSDLQDALYNESLRF